MCYNTLLIGHNISKNWNIIMPKRNEVIAPRRFLPPIGWLVAFEAVARRGSVTSAAEELNLTQGAVSRQVQKLEDQIGLQLFLRDKQRLHLTMAGAAYAEDVRQGINQIANAGIRLRTNPEGGELNLAVLPAFATHWLAPRLADFVTAHPGVTVNLSTRTKPFDFSNETFHAAIHFGSDDWPETRSLRLMQEEAIAIASPGILNEIDSAEDILRLPLLHLETRADAWRKWFHLQQVPVDHLPGLQFDQFATMIQAATFGLGAAIVPKYLVSNELERGSLVTINDFPPLTIGSYFLVWPKRSATYPPILAFKEWIEGIVKK